MVKNETVITNGANGAALSCLSFANEPANHRAAQNFKPPSFWSCVLDALATSCNTFFTYKIAKSLSYFDTIKSIAAGQSKRESKIGGTVH
jgi:hypothetical protein